MGFFPLFFSFVCCCSFSRFYLHNSIIIIVFVVAAAAIYADRRVKRIVCTAFINTYKYKTLDVSLSPSGARIFFFCSIRRICDRDYYFIFIALAFLIPFFSFVVLVRYFCCIAKHATCKAAK